MKFINLQTIKSAIDRGVRITYEQVLNTVLAPAHMLGPWSQRWLTVFGAYVELWWWVAQASADVGFPNTCPDDALDLVGAMFNIERIPGEVNGFYRERLKAGFDAWEMSGTAAGIEQQLGAYGLTTEVWDIAAGWDPGDDADTSVWRFWIVVRQPHQWVALEAGDDVVAGDQLVAGITMTADTYRILRRIVHKWRPAHARPVEFIVVFSGVMAGPTTVAGDALVAGGDACVLPITGPVAGRAWAGSTAAGYYVLPN